MTLDGESPRYRQTPVWLALCTLFGVVFLLMMVTANRKQLRLLTTGALVEARCMPEKGRGASVRLSVTFETPRGPVSMTRTLPQNEPQGVLGDPNPVVASDMEDLREVFILSECPGLRVLAEGEVAPVAWHLLAWRALPVAVLVAVSVYSLWVSRLLPP